MKRILLIIFALIILIPAKSAWILIPMDGTQTNHLKAYGITYWTLENQVEAWWLLNYRGGSFMTFFAKEIERECILRGVSYEIIADGQKNAIFNEIS
ncbi:MAG: asparagine synthetase B, partial [Bacteroidales bacterium]|nr:asparagine synthetase B [Bacteroidales bacterium]